MAVPTLADVLDQWLADQRLSIAELARMAGVGRPTIYKMRSGERPSVETLRKIARGLATTPRSGQFDADAYSLAARDLFAAAGYEQPPEVHTVPVEEEIARMVKSRATAEQIVEVLRRYPSLNRDKRLLLEAAIRIAAE